MAILKVWDNSNSDWLVPTNNATDNILLRVYPVGSIYMSVNNIDPGTLFGGTWVAWGSGRVPVGVDTAQTEFNTVDKTGGAKTHTLSLSQIPNVTGSLVPHGAEGGSSLWQPGGVFSGSPTIGQYRTVNSAAGGASSVTNISFSLGGGGQAHNNLQPYITCYMFKRVS